VSLSYYLTLWRNIKICQKTESDVLVLPQKYSIFKWTSTVLQTNILAGKSKTSKVTHSNHSISTKIGFIAELVYHDFTVHQVYTSTTSKPCSFHWQYIIIHQVALALNTKNLNEVFKYTEKVGLHEQIYQQYH